MGPGIFDSFMSGVRRTFDLFRSPPQKTAAKSIPTSLVQEALRQANKSYSADAIITLCKLSGDAKTPKERRLLQEQVLKLVENQKFHQESPAQKQEVINHIATLICNGVIQDPTTIKNYQLRFEVASAVAKAPQGDICSKIGSFKLEENERFAIAKIVARESPSFLLHFIKNFNINNQTYLVELAKTCSEDSTIRSIFPTSILTWCITDQKSLFEIIKICINVDSCETAERFKDFGLTDKQLIIAAAKHLAAKNGPACAEHIADFAIDDAATLLEIAKLSATESGYTADFIENFGIKDPVILREFATLCAQTAGACTAENLHKFGEMDVKERIELAKLCAKEDGAR